MADIFERRNKENLRVIQRDLVYAVGIPITLAKEEVAVVFAIVVSSFYLVYHFKQLMV